MMRILIIGFLMVATFAAPCIYDVFSSEPSPLASLLAVAGLTG